MATFDESTNDQKRQRIIDFGIKNQKTSDEIRVALGKFETSIGGGEQQNIVQKTISRVKENIGDIKQTVGGIKGRVKTAKESIKETVTSKDLGVGEKVLGVGSDVFRGSARAVGDVFAGVVRSALPESAEDKVRGVLDEVGKDIAEQPITQELIERYNSLHPDDRRNVDNALGFAEGFGELLGFGAVGRLKQSTLKVAMKALDTVSEGTKRTSSLARVLVVFVQKYQPVLWFY